MGSTTAGTRLCRFRPVGKCWARVFSFFGRWWWLWWLWWCVLVMLNKCTGYSTCRRRGAWWIWWALMASLSPLRVPPLPAVPCRMSPAAAAAAAAVAVFSPLSLSSPLPLHHYHYTTAHSYTHRHASPSNLSPQRARANTQTPSHNQDNSICVFGTSLPRLPARCQLKAASDRVDSGTASAPKEETSCISPGQRKKQKVIRL